MLKHIDVTRQRVEGFAKKLAGLFYRDFADVELAVYAAPGRISYSEAMQASYRPLQECEKFGPLWSTHWVKVNLVIPSGWDGCEVHLLWDSSSEACVWHDGEPLQGLTGSFSGWANEALRREFCVTKQVHAGESDEYFVEVACNGLFGLDNPSNNERIGELRQAALACFDREAWELYWDLKVIADMALHLPGDTPRGGQAIWAANEMVNAIRLEDRATWPAARQIAARFFHARNGDGQHNLSAIGHAHIDSAWLWPIAETRRKCVRTFASATRYMEEYPEYMFACSQALQVDWMKTDYPALYQRMQEQARAGKFIPVGGTWVEPDCNIPSGEALVRQFLYGQRFFEQEFGQRCTEFWNPDVFGYSGALPQIMKLAGIEYFLTQKLSWNQFNKPASHTFLWEGIDGTQILTHFPPADTYNSMADVKEVLYNVSNFKDHERARESLLLFGYGDGGGGPTTAMLEQLGRMKDVDGLPRTQIRAPREFFERCAADIKDPLVQVGELYFELHRGTYTTQARNKKYNRRSELLLRDAEMLAALAAFNQAQTYPAAELEELWKLVLTNQFHDIIPGSSIHEVYVDSAEDYEYVLAKGVELRSQALESLLSSSKPDGKVAIFNTLGFERSAVVELPDGVKGAQMGAAGAVLGLVSAPALGYAIVNPRQFSESPASAAATKTGYQLKNGFLRAEFNAQGGLISLVDLRSGRECIEPGQAGNTFVVYEDLPNKWEAWDVDVFHLEKRLEGPKATSAKILEEGPLRASLAFEYHLSAGEGSSVIWQVVSLDALAQTLVFSCEVEWRERQKFLKVEFPLNLRAQTATYEIQFGHVQRPTHFNTSQDMARFEVPAQRWGDLSEPDFGVALLNDCKYGYAAHGNVLRLSLLRAPIYPDALADQGRHSFRYGIYPHAGGPQAGGVVEAACCFNTPLLVLPGGGEESRKSFFSMDRAALIVDTIKQAEDGDGLVVRMYEAHGTRGKARLRSSLKFNSVSRVNLLEDEMEPLEWVNGELELDYHPFEIISVKLKK